MPEKTAAIRYGLIPYGFYGQQKKTETFVQSPPSEIGKSIKNSRVIIEPGFLIMIFMLASMCFIYEVSINCSVAQGKRDIIHCILKLKHKNSHVQR